MTTTTPASADTGDAFDPGRPFRTRDGQKVLGLPINKFCPGRRFGYVESEKQEQNWDWATGKHKTTSDLDLVNVDQPPATSKSAGGEGREDDAAFVERVLALAKQGATVFFSPEEMRQIANLVREVVACRDPLIKSLLAEREACACAVRRAFEDYKDVSAVEFENKYGTLDLSDAVFRAIRARTIPTPTPTTRTDAEPGERPVEVSAADEPDVWLAAAAGAFVISRDIDNKTDASIFTHMRAAREAGNKALARRNARLEPAGDVAAAVLAENEACALIAVSTNRDAWRCRNDDIAAAIRARTVPAAPPPDPIQDHIQEHGWPETLPCPVSVDAVRGVVLKAGAPTRDLLRALVGAKLEGGDGVTEAEVSAAVLEQFGPGVCNQPYDVQKRHERNTRRYLEAAARARLDAGKEPGR